MSSTTCLSPLEKGCCPVQSPQKSLLCPSKPGHPAITVWPSRVLANLDVCKFGKRILILAFPSPHPPHVCVCVCVCKTLLDSAEGGGGDAKGEAGGAGGGGVRGGGDDKKTLF